MYETGRKKSRRLLPDRKDTLAFFPIRLYKLFRECQNTVCYVFVFRRFGMEYDDLTFIIAIPDHTLQNNKYCYNICCRSCIVFQYRLLMKSVKA